MCGHKQEPASERGEGGPVPGRESPGFEIRAAADSGAEAAGETPWLAFSVGAARIYVAKAADSRNLPEGSYEGKTEFERTLRAKPAGRILLHIFAPGGRPSSVPADREAFSFRHLAEGRETPLPAPRLMYRMPNSPLRTFVIVDAAAPGRILARGRDGESAVLDLSARRLQDLPLFWEEHPPRTLSTRLPRALYGSLSESK